MYIHEREHWTDFSWDHGRITTLAAGVRFAQGRLLGRMEALGFPLRDEALLRARSLDVVKSSEIEGEKLDESQVRSSIARKMGIAAGGLVASSRFVDGVVDILLDATRNHRKPITVRRLFAWHRKLFPGGKSGLYRIEVGTWRSSRMQVVSGGIGHEKVHYEAPAPQRVPGEMAAFLDWLRTPGEDEPIVRAAIAHLWFVTIHPFDDGNGRIARTLTDYVLAQADDTPLRFYSISNQIMAERDDYYRILEATQHGDGDINAYLEWFIGCVGRAVAAAQENLGGILAKAEFFRVHPDTGFNARQRKILNMLFDGFKGNLTSGKWAKICKCSVDTALNDATNLVRRGILARGDGGGRSTNYVLVRVDSKITCSSRGGAGR